MSKLEKCNQFNSSTGFSHIVFIMVEYFCYSMYLCKSNSIVLYWIRYIQKFLLFSILFLNIPSATIVIYISYIWWCNLRLAKFRWGTCLGASPVPRCLRISEIKSRQVYFKLTQLIFLALASRVLHIQGKLQAII